jgi:hypothetical protein
VSDFSLSVPEALVEEIAERVAERVLERLDAHRDNRSPWLSGAAAAAAYLDWPRERVFKNLHTTSRTTSTGRGSCSVATSWTHAWNSTEKGAPCPGTR